MVDAEALARWVYARTSCSLESPPGPLFLLRLLVGDQAIAFHDDDEVVVDDRRGLRVTLPRGLAAHRLCLSSAIAVARVGARIVGGELTRRDELEAAIAVIMPRESVRAACRACGPRSEHLASIFVIDVRLAAHRLRRLGLRLASGQYVRPTLRSAG